MFKADTDIILSVSAFAVLCMECCGIYIKAAFHADKYEKLFMDTLKASLFHVMRFLLLLIFYAEFSLLQQGKLCTKKDGTL